jgi:hypothetical protein
MVCWSGSSPAVEATAKVELSGATAPTDTEAS